MKAITLLCIFLSVLFSVRALAFELPKNQENLTSETRVDLKKHLHNLEHGTVQEKLDAIKSIEGIQNIDPDLRSEFFSQALAKEEDNKVLGQLTASMVNVGSELGFDEIVKYAKDKGSKLRMHSLKALSDSNLKSEVVSTFMMAIFDHDPKVRTQAAIGLANRSDNPIAFSVLSGRIGMADDSEAQLYVATGIKNSGNPKAITVLISALNNTKSGGRKYAALALANEDHPGVVEALINASNNGDEQLVFNSTASLSTLSKGNEKAITQLLKIYSNNNNSVIKNAALRGIVKSKDPRAKHIALVIIKQLKPVELISDAIEVIVEHGDINDASQLAALLKSDDPNIRANAYDAITKMLNKHVNLQQLKNAMKCLAITNREPMADDAKNYSTLARSFMIAFGAYASASPTGVNIQKISEDEHQSLKEALLGLIPKS
jgi:HEAT repeat protein